VQDAVDNAKSVASEAGHRADAGAEQEKREVAGDGMALGDKARSLLNQAKDTAQANLDAMKRDGHKNAAP
jgi:hypothetical protein